mgnify:CR=1 FL=1
MSGVLKIPVGYHVGNLKLHQRCCLEMKFC